MVDGSLHYMHFDRLNGNPMDWVQNKTGGKKSKHPKSSAKNPAELVSTETNQTASEWFAEICQENIERLQQTLGAVSDSPKKSKKALDANRHSAALLWGIRGLLSENCGDLSPLLAFVEAEQGSADTPDYDKMAKRLAAWIGKQLPRHSEEAAVALCSVAWIYGLPRVGRALQAAEWLETLQSILSQIDRAWANQEPESLLSWLIWSCEIPLALATQLSQLGGRDRVVSETLDRLAASIEAAADQPEDWIESGAVHLRALLACVIRCRWSADRIGARQWYGPQRKAIQKLAMIAVAAMDKNAKPLFQDASICSSDDTFWEALFEAAGKPDKLATAFSIALPKHLVTPAMKKGMAQAKVAKKGSKKDSKKESQDKGLVKQLGSLGFHHEKAEFALMRASWANRGCRMAINYGDDPIWLDVLDHQGDRLMSGWWEVAISKNGKPLDVDCGWSEVCWFSDDDVDYLELQCEVEGVCTIQRQALLVRADGLLFFADALIGTEEAEWELETRFPLESGTRFVQEKSTRDGRLIRNEESNELAWVFPLAMPEWKRQPFSGDILEEGDCLTLVQTLKGKRLYSPMALTLHPRAKTDGQTWRQLTVAEDLRIVNREEAAAYRVQTGKSHWVMYRSLGPTTRRTAIGLHINSEFYACRFHRKSGEIDTLVEVDAEAS